MDEEICVTLTQTIHSDEDATENTWSQPSQKKGDSKEGEPKSYNRTLQSCEKETSAQDRGVRVWTCEVGRGGM